MNGAFGYESIFKAGEASELAAFQTRQLGYHQAGGGANGGYGTAALPVILQNFHKLSVLGQVLGAGHTTGENHHVRGFGAGFHHFCIGPTGVCRYFQPMRTFHHIFLCNGYSHNRHTAAQQNIPRGQGFHVFEAVSQE